MPETFGAELARLREGAGLTLRNLAEVVDVDHTYLSHIENGRRTPNPELIDRLATIFGVSAPILQLRAGLVPDHLLDVLQQHPEESLEALERLGSSADGDRPHWYWRPEDLFEGRDGGGLLLPGLDSYDRPPFASHIRAGKNTSIYSAHSYHTKVPYQGIIPYIEHYTEPGDLVLDPFCGSGMTGVAAILTGRDAIMCDVSPAAVHIARNYTTPCDSQQLEDVYRRLQQTLAHVEEGLYSTSCDRCGAPGRIEYTVFTDVLECSSCTAELTVWRHGRDGDGKLLSTVTCPACQTSHKRNDLTWLRSDPCLVNLSCRSECAKGRLERPPTDADLDVIRRIARQDPPAWVPSHAFGPAWEMWRKGHEDRGITDVREFFTPRNLHALSAIHKWIRALADSRVASALLFAFTGCVNRASKRYQWNHKRPTNVLSGTLYVSSLFYEFNVFRLFHRKVRAAIRLFRSTAAATGRAAVVQTSATDLGSIPDASVDYVFTDPPFGSNIFYADCSLLWEAWLDEYTDTREEIVVSRSRSVDEGGKTLADYQALLTGALLEIRRVLKPNRWASVVFHNSSAEVWKAVRHACLDAGFTLSNAMMFDKRHKSFKALKGAKGEERVAHYDIVLNLQKSPPVTAGIAGAAPAQARIVEVVRAHLAALPDDAPGDERSTAFLHSLAVQEVLASDLELEPIDLQPFTRLLAREFVGVEGKWYLPEPEDRKPKAAELEMASQ